VRRLALAACLALSWAGADSSAEVFTLDDCLRLSMRNSAELESAQQAITIARQRVNEATFLFLPEVGLQALATRFDSRYPFALRPSFPSILLFPSNQPNLYSGQAYLNLPLYEGRRNINTLRMAKTALKQAETNYEAVKLNVTFSARRDFYQLIMAQEMRSSAEEAASRAEDIFKGMPGNWERAEAGAIVSELRAGAAEARHSASLAKMEFLKGLNKELDADVAVSGALEAEPVDLDLRKALIWAAELRPELQSQTYKSQMDAIAVNLTIGRSYPSVALGIDYSLTGQTFPLKDNNWDATVGVKLPFAFDFWTQRTQKLAEQRQGEIARSELQNQVELEVRRAFEDAVFWQGEWARREDAFSKLKAFAVEASRAGSNLLESLRSEARLLKSRQAFLKSLLEHILARARLERAIGRSLSP
jgi:outer membrane protein TolC